MEKSAQENQPKLVDPLFVAASAVPNEDTDFILNLVSIKVVL